MNIKCMHPGHAAGSFLLMSLKRCMVLLHQTVALRLLPMDKVHVT